jgi:hypothetical protein
VTVVKILGVAATMLLIVGMSFVWWRNTLAVSMPLPPPSPRQTVAPIPAKAGVRLQYDFDYAQLRYGMISLRNQSRFAWTHIHVHIGAGGRNPKEFLCPAVYRVGSGETLMMPSALCRSADDLAPTQLCGVSLDADEGSLGTNLEPCFQLDAPIRLCEASVNTKQGSIGIAFESCLQLKER